jgi:hydroxymethylbilane synthase
MSRILKIGTRESKLAVWQAQLVQGLLQQHGYESELVYITSEGDIDLKTPLYELGVQGIFTKTLDIALLEGRIDLAVHSMKDVPTILAKGIVQAAVLERGTYKDLLVFKGNTDFLNDTNSQAVIATSSIRRKAQWLNRYPNHIIENLRGNVNTRLQKVADSNWDGAIFAAAGVERINVRPENSIELDWMLPAPAQGAIMVVCKEIDYTTLGACSLLNHPNTALCTSIERAFLRTLMGGCATPISAHAEVRGDMLEFKGSILSVDGKQKKEVNKIVPKADTNVGRQAAEEILQDGGQAILDKIRNAN